MDKQATRRAIRTRRSTRSEDDLRVAAAALAAHARLLAGATVAGFVGVRGEPPTLPLLEALVARGATVIVPILRSDMDLEWAPYTGSVALVEGRLGMLEPRAPSLGLGAIGRADLVLVPALAVDRTGRRLGQGGGSYDRALPRAAGPIVAIVFDDEVLRVVPTETHDRTVDGVLTPEGGLLWISPGIESGDPAL